jgi:hypothetical protein
MQDGSTSRMLHTIANATARFSCLAFENLTKSFIRLVLDILGENLQLPIANQCLADQARKRRIIETLFSSGLR